MCNNEAEGQRRTKELCLKISHPLQETWTHSFTGKISSPGLKSLCIKASRQRELWIF